MVSKIAYLWGIMDLSNTFFLLGTSQFLVTGAARGAIYDLNSGDVFSLEPHFTHALEACEARKSLQEVINSTPDITPDILLSFVNQLVEYQLGEVYETDVPPYLQKIKPVLTRNQMARLFIPKHPTYAFIEIETECNQNCRFCKIDDPIINRQTGCTRRTTTHNLKIEEWYQVIDDLIWLKCPTLHIIGGEPWLNPDLLKSVIQYARQQGIINIYVMTNTLLLDDEKIAFMAHYQVQPVIQLYSSQSIIHDKLTGVPGSFHQIIANLQKFRDYGIEFAISLLLTEEGINHHQKTVEFIQSLRPQRMFFDFVRSDSQVMAPFLYRIQPQFNKINKEYFFASCEGHTCWQGKLAIDAEGNVSPCISDHLNIIGNIRTESLKSLYGQGKMDRYWHFTKDDIEDCSVCEYRFVCFDCRPIIQSMTHDLKGKDPFCTYDPREGKWGTIPMPHIKIGEI